MLRGELVNLRSYRREDAELIRSLLNDEEVLYYLRPETAFPLTEKDEEDFIDSISAFSTSRYSFGIESLRTGELIGGCGFEKISCKNRCATVGLFIGDKSLWDKGYGTDTMKVLLRFAFDEMNLNRLKLTVYAFNERAIACYEKCGFVREGVGRQEVFKRGAYHDVIQMGILRSEYEALGARTRGSGAKHEGR